VANVSDLVGLTMASVQASGDEMLFEAVGGRSFRLYHNQDCCESVAIEEIHGDLSDLVGVPILSAEESTNEDNPPKHAESWLWTFYRFTTINGSVTVRWLGESNGYYSERVDFAEVGA
jgi:hypothetical protein